jgi:hypothetical protein
VETSRISEQSESARKPGRSENSTGDPRRAIVPPLAAIGHPPSLFFLVKVELGLGLCLESNTVRHRPSTPSSHEDRLVLDRRKSGDKRLNASTHMLSLVVPMIGLMNAPRSLIVSRMPKMSGRPGQQIAFADQWNIPPAAMSCEGPCLLAQFSGRQLWLGLVASSLFSDAFSRDQGRSPGPCRGVHRPPPSAQRMNRDVSGRADSR